MGFRELQGDEAFKRDLDQALLSLLKQHFPQLYVTNFALVVECFDQEAEGKALITQTREGAASWEAIGLYRMAQLLEEAEVITEYQSE